ncbi:MAG: hypothetical protein ACYC3S_08910 [Chloroflexota bacterium]
MPVPIVALACATLAWATSLRDLDPAGSSDFGLISVLPPAYFAALALVTLGFGFALNNRRTPNWVLFLHVAVLIVIIYGTPSLAYGTLRYSWAWKHVGMVDYIQRWGTVNPSIASLADLSANHNWPGFFALGALLTQAGGFATALQFAQLAPLFFNLLNIGALLLVLGSLVQDRRLRWLAVWLFYLGNWIGQDYFAPQAMAYFFSLVTVGLTLTWFASRPRLLGSGGGTRRLGAWLESFWARFDGPGEAVAGIGRASTPGQRVGVLAIMILLFAVIASSHQLTPFMTILSLSALAITYRTSARSLPVLMAVITATWTMYMAWAFVGGNLTWIIQSFGRLDRNTTVTDLSRVSQGQIVVALAARGLTLLIGGLGLAGFVRSWRKGKRYMAFALLAIAPMPMIVTSSYSGEMSFRVYFFALPYLAFFGAALVYPTVANGRSWRAPLAVIAISGLLLAGLLLSYYGRERMNYFSQNEIDAASYLYSIAPAGSLIIGGSYDYPSLFQDYERYTHTTLTGQSVTRNQLARLQNDPLTTVTRLMGDRTYRATYLIITRSQRAHIQMDNLLPQTGIDQIEQVLRQSGQYRVIYRNQDAEIFTLASQAEVRR